MKILITGISGYLGYELAKKLGDHEIIGLDIKEPKKKLPNNVSFIHKSILDSDLEKIFKKFQLDTCIHLAWTVTPVHKKELKKAFDVDFNGTKFILENCKTFNVKHIIFMSSTLAYGALKNNPERLTEEDPLRARKSFHYAYHKKIVEEELLKPFIKNNPSIKVTILRAPGFFGPMANNYIASILRSKILPVMIGGRLTRIQFLHITDLLNVIDLFVQKKAPGVFNVTPDDNVMMKDIPKILPGFKIYTFESLARFFVFIGWSIHLYSAPSSYLDFVRFEFLASNQKIKDNLGWNPSFSTIDAIKSLISHKNKEK